MTKGEASAANARGPAVWGWLILAAAWVGLAVVAWIVLLRAGGQRHVLMDQMAKESADTADDESGPAAAKARRAKRLLGEGQVTGRALRWANGARGVLWTRNIVWALAAAGAVVGFYASRRDTRVFGPRGSAWGLLLGVTGTLIVVMCAWNAVFLRYVMASGFVGDVFRGSFHSVRAPVYGQSETPVWPWWLVPVGVSVGLLVVAVIWREGLLNGRLGVWVLVAFHVALAVSLAMSDGWVRGEGFRRLNAETGVRPWVDESRGYGPAVKEILRTYVDRLAREPQRFARMSHYPPGNLVAQYTLQWIGFGWAHKWIVIVLMALGALPLYGLVRELGGDRPAGRMAHLLYMTATMVLVFATMDFGVLAAPLAGVCMWLLVRAVKRRERWSALLLGLAMAVFGFYIFTVTLVGAVMGMAVVLWLLTRQVTWRSTIETAAISMTVFVGCFLILYKLTGFDILACLRTGMANERQHMGSGFDDPARYVLRASGHVIAYLVQSGFAMVGLALMALPSLWPWRKGDSADSTGLLAGFAWAVMAGLLLAGLSGGFHGETERVWIVFTPLLAVLAGCELRRRMAREPGEKWQGRWLLAGLLLVAIAGSCAQELFYRHQGRNYRKEATATDSELVEREG